MMIEQEEKQRYLDDGYCVARNLIPEDAIKAARHRVHEMMEDQPDWAAESWQVLDPARKVNSRGQALPTGIQRPGKYEAVFGDFAGHPNLIAAMAELLGGEVELFTDQIGIKHGFIDEEQGGRSYYHQDSLYWKIEPERGTNCWIPFDEVEADGIALGVRPGSQRGWELHPHEDYFDIPNVGRINEGSFKKFPRHRIPTEDVDFSGEIVVPMHPGDGLFFSNYTWHRSEPNRSGETRMFYAIAYQLTEDAITERKSK